MGREVKIGAVLSLLFVVLAVSPQAQTASKVTIQQGETSFWTQTNTPSLEVATTTLVISKDGTITLKQALDPMTVLCVEHQPNTYTVSSGTIYLGDSYRPAKPEQKSSVPDIPMLPSRTCMTVSAWLVAGQK